MRRVNCTPPSSCNCFALLPIESVVSSDSSDSESGSEDVHSINLPRASSSRIAKWERRLPKRYILASTPSSDSISLGVTLQTTDTGETHATPALLDCGATGLFVDAQYVRDTRMSTRTLARPIPVYNVDGTLNEAGSIRELVNVIL